MRMDGWHMTDGCVNVLIKTMYGTLNGNHSFIIKTQYEHHRNNVWNIAFVHHTSTPPRDLLARSACLTHSLDPPLTSPHSASLRLTPRYTRVYTVTFKVRGIALCGSKGRSTKCASTLDRGRRGRARHGWGRRVHRRARYRRASSFYSVTFTQ